MGGAIHDPIDEPPIEWDTLNAREPGLSARPPCIGLALIGAKGNTGICVVAGRGGV